MLLEILAKLTSESLLSLYPIFVKKIGISSNLQLWSRLITYVAIAALFVDWSFIKSSIWSLDSLTLGLVNLSHIYFSYEGFRHLDSGVSFAIFNSYPLMILLLAGVVWHKGLLWSPTVGTEGAFYSYLLAIVGIGLFIYGNYSEKKDETGEIDFNYGLIMILLAALTEAFIYFLVRRVKTTNNWNHLFISYFLGAVIMTAYVVYNHQDYVVEDKTRVGLSMLINGVIGSVGYVLRFFSSYRLDPEIYAPLSYFGVVMSYIYGMLFDNETLNWKKILGTVSILASNYIAPKKI